MIEPFQIPYYFDKNIVLYLGDSLDVLINLRDESINCVVTSPPYFQLRDYDTGFWLGGDEDCDHIKVSGGTQKSTIGDSYYRNNMSEKSVVSTIKASFIKYGNECKKCGARRFDKQIGLEDTVDEYIDKLVLIFREIKRVLTKDGTVFLNLGDKHENKKILGVPWRVAFSLENDGWNIISDIVWNKTNAMPSSVKSRPTRSHEYIFLLSKNKNYYWDYEAALEDAKWERWGKQTVKKQAGTSLMTKERTKEEIERDFNTKKRNMRSVWTSPTAAFSDAHFAVFPKFIPNKAIPAGCPPGGVVLDPFVGSGTTCISAFELGRQSIGIDLSEENLNICLKRFRELEDVEKC